METEGRYYFSPEGTPTYPGFHNLGSSTYISNEQTSEALGEVKGAQRTWDNGAPPAALPLAILVGSADCVSSGEDIQAIDPQRTLINGFEQECFLNPKPPGLFANECHDWEFSLELLRRLYAQDFAGIDSLVLNRFPGVAITNIASNQGTLPSRTIVVHNDWSAIFFAGTENYQQLALQAFDIATGPTAFTYYSTLLFWESNASQVAAELSGLGVDPHKPISLWGHSYGGVIASIIGAKLFAHLGNPEQIQLVTFGSPQPGNSSMANLLGKIPSRHFVNDYDPVPYLPPGATDWTIFGGIVGAQLRRLWGEWRHPYPLTGVTLDGEQYLGPDITSTYPLIVDAIARLLIGFPQPTFTSHTLAEYQRRVRCGPMPPTVVNSVTCPDGSIIVNPITGDVVELINTSHSNHWVAPQLFEQANDVVNAIYCQASANPTVPALYVSGLTADTETLFGVDTLMDGPQRWCFLVGSHSVLMTGSVVIGSQYFMRPFALQVVHTRNETGVQIRKDLPGPSPGPCLDVGVIHMGTSLGVNGSGRLMSDLIEPIAPLGSPVGRWKVYAGDGTLLGLIPIYPPSDDEVIFDVFIDTDGKALPAHPIWPMNATLTAWNADAGTFDIQSNRANALTLGGLGLGMASCDSGVSDGTVSCTVNMDASTFGGVVVRGSDPNNCWLAFVFAGAAAVFLYKIVSGTVTFVASSAAPISAGTDIALKVTLLADAITVNVDGTNLISLTGQTFNQTATRHGLMSGGAAVCTYDDFKVIP